ncbi:type 1 glutamine amidotransferase domain-containing protein [Aneurinibacillus sp. REN35]|uniref:type 1 glutamine amidotransferase domain-containing protein n=1 Tax=Aneurinibacillus sp. REN35 TaxID=3237286 RepID=UPI0035297DD1
MANVLFILSSGYKNSDYETGWWAEELFAPMLAVEEAGHKADIASPKGGKPTVDKVSLSAEWDPDGKYKKLYESGRVDHTLKLAEVDPRSYAAVVIVGGHGAMFDLANNEEVRRIVNAVYDNNGIVGAECHGPAALIWTHRPDGKSILSGKDVTGYPDVHEPEEVKEYLPFSLEQELSGIANYIPNLEEESFAVWADEQIVLSRDPMSSEAMGRELVKALSGK